jgi:hypothetical protein
MSYGLRIGRGMGKILSRKGLQVKYYGIRAYVQVQGRLGDQWRRCCWDSLRAYSEHGLFRILGQGCTSQEGGILVVGLWKTCVAGGARATRADVKQVPPLRRRIRSGSGRNDRDFWPRGEDGLCFCRPSGAPSCSNSPPTACAVGCILSPLRGWSLNISNRLAASG